MSDNKNGKKTELQPLVTVERLQIKHKITDSCHAGTLTLMGWSACKEVTEEQYLKAVEAFKIYPKTKEIENA